MKMKNGMVFLAVFLCLISSGSSSASAVSASAVSASAAEKSNLVLDLSYGPHAVGFRVVRQYDQTRSYRRVDAEGHLISETARPMQTLIWYPAQPEKNAKPMLYGSYLDLFATEENFSVPESEWAAKVRIALQIGSNLKNYDREKVQVTRAYRDARAESGRFPVLIYAPSFSAPAFENSDLCEFLASHGYIVVSSPDMGAHRRGMTGDLEGVEAQAGDIEFLVGYLFKIPEADTAHIAVAGFSWGGMSDVFAAAHDDRISAIISLDGTVRYLPALVKKAVDAQILDPRRLTAPYLYFASKPDTLEDMSRSKADISYSFLNELKYDDFYFLQSAIMIHPDYCSFYIRFREDHMFSDYSQADVGQSYSWMARYVLQFLNAYLKNDAAGLQFLKNSPEKNSVPRFLFSENSREALRPAPTIPDFARALASEGFDKATAVYQKAKQNDPSFKLDEGLVNYWGYELLFNGKLPQAVAIFKLNAAMYPESANVYDSLAEAEADSGDKAAAIANYRKSLEINPDNWNAKSHLKDLEGEKKQ